MNENLNKSLTKDQIELIREIAHAPFKFKYKEFMDIGDSYYRFIERANQELEKLQLPEIKNYIQLYI